MVMWPPLFNKRRRRTKKLLLSPKVSLSIKKNNYPPKSPSHLPLTSFLSHFHLFQNPSLSPTLQQRGVKKRSSIPSRNFKLVEIGKKEKKKILKKKNHLRLSTPKTPEDCPCKLLFFSPPPPPPPMSRSAKPFSPELVVRFRVLRRRLCCCCGGVCDGCCGCEACDWDCD